MLPSTGLFKKLTCPEYPRCHRMACVFSHDAPKVAPKRKQPTHSEPVQEQSQPTKMLKQEAAKKKPIGLQPIAASMRQTTQRPLNQTAPRQPQTAIRPRSAVLPSTSTAAATGRTTPLSGSQRNAHTHVISGNRAAPAANTPTPTIMTTTAGTGPPRIVSDIRSHAPLKLRQITAQKLYEQFCRIYEPLGNPSLATEHAERQEKTILSQTTNPAGYKQMAMTALIQLKKRPLSTSAVDIGIDGEWTPPPQPGNGESEGAGSALVAKAKAYVLTPEQLKQMGYPELPDDDEEEQSVQEKDEAEQEGSVGTRKKCDRCKQEYIVKEMLSPGDENACVFHHGRMYMTMSFGEKQRVYSCCGDSFSNPGCAKGPHVYKDNSVKQMHAKIPYISTPKEKPKTWRALVALDCEMAYTTAGMELIRLTAIDENEKLLLDELVFPSGMVIDLNTRYSGIKTLAGASHNLESVRQELFKYVNADTILMGHGLENDLNAMRIFHGNVIDTAALFPHPKGLPYRYGLRVLSAKYLSRFIQESLEGHDSFEDAKTCVELLKVFLQKASK